MLSTLRHHSGKKTGHFPNGLAGLIKYWMSHCDVLWTPSHNDTQSQDNWDPKLSYITCGTLRLCKNENAFCYVTSFTRSLKIKLTAAAEKRIQSQNCLEDRLVCELRSAPQQQDSSVSPPWLLGQCCQTQVAPLSSEEILRSPALLVGRTVIHSDPRAGGQVIPLSFVNAAATCRTNTIISEELCVHPHLWPYTMIRNKNRPKRGATKIPDTLLWI